MATSDMSAPVGKQSLKDELKADRGIEGPIPKMIQVLASMSEANRAEWKEMLADKSITSLSISRGLCRRGYTVGRTAVQRYRDGNQVHRES